jgi:hypothetical protein
MEEVLKLSKSMQDEMTKRMDANQKKLDANMKTILANNKEAMLINERQPDEGGRQHENYAR